ncbi:hypothetical protein C8Q80DRAFT_1119527 [Daedaleopsis nitida]|nr:hypothetical protein C8Q80DRAFT_1119527 [Daedaleopsis nitida]
MPPMQRTVTIRAPPQQAVGGRTAARVLRQRICELEQEEEDSHILAVKMTPEEYKLLHDTFASVKGEFHDLDGLSWQTPQARQVLHDWHAKQAVRQRPPCASPGGLRTRRHNHRRGSLSVVLSPSPTGSPRLDIEDVVLEDNAETIRVRLRPTYPGSLMTLPTASQSLLRPAPQAPAENPSPSESELPAAADLELKNTAHNHAIFTLAHPRKRMIKTLSTPMPSNLTFSLASLPPADPADALSTAGDSNHATRTPPASPNAGPHSFAPTPYSSPILPHSSSAPAGMSGLGGMHSPTGMRRAKPVRRPGIMPGIVLVCKGRGAAGKAREKPTDCAGPDAAKGGPVRRTGSTASSRRRLTAPSDEDGWADVDDDEHEQAASWSGQQVSRMERLCTQTGRQCAPEEPGEDACSCTVCQRSAALSFARDGKPGEPMVRHAPGCAPAVRLPEFVEGCSQVPHVSAAEDVHVRGAPVSRRRGLD